MAQENEELPDRIEAFKRFVSRNKLTSFLIIIGITVIAAAKFKESFEEIIEIGPPDRFKRDYIESMNLKIDSIATGYKNLETSKFNLQDYYQIGILVESISSTLPDIVDQLTLAESDELSKKMIYLKVTILNEIYRLIELSGDGSSGQRVNLAIVRSCHTAHRLCEILPIVCTSDEIEVISQTEAFYK